jgi:hypothetical protein
VDETVKKWGTQGIITRVPSNVDNRWNSPLTLAPKKDSSGRYTAKRPCLDPRHINRYLKEDQFPLPKIGDIFLKLKDAIVYTTLDLTNAFHRFPIHPPHQHKTAFTSVDGLQYMFRGCPFGLKPISSKFQRVMTTLFSAKPFHTFVATFVDDIVIYSTSYQAHADHVQLVIEELTRVNLTLNPLKCHFAQKTIYLLGFCVKAKGESNLDTRKVTNVQVWPQPTSGKQIQQFLGLVNYFRLYIPYFAELTAPLDALRNHDGQLGHRWTEAPNHFIWTLMPRIHFGSKVGMYLFHHIASNWKIDLFVAVVERDSLFVYGLLSLVLNGWEKYIFNLRHSFFYLVGGEGLKFFSFFFFVVFKVIHLPCEHYSKWCRMSYPWAKSTFSTVT